MCVCRFLPGRADGNIYEAYHNLVRAQNPIDSTKEHPYFAKLIKPLLEREGVELMDDAAAMELDEEIAEIIAEKKNGENRKAGEEEPKIDSEK